MIRTITLIFINFIVYSQDYGKVHELVTEGIDAIYNVDFNLALSKFQEAKSVAPDDLRGQFFESTVYFWKSMLTRNKTDYETFLNLSDRITKKCEDILDKNEGDLNARLYLGWLQTIRAFALGFIGESYLKSASEIKDGSNNLKYIIEQRADIYDAYLGLGLYNYLASFIPKKLQWLTSLLGFSGDRNEGKRMLSVASEKGIYTTTEAKFYMTLLSWREENYPVAETYAQALLNRYPQSPAVWMLWGGLLSQQDKMKDAIEAYEKAIYYNNSARYEIIYKVAYGALSSAYFRTNNFDKAAEFGKLYISYTTKDDNLNNRLYSIGVSLELLGKRSEAIEYYSRARTDFKADNQWEKFWLRKIRQRQASPIGKSDSLLIIADNFRATGMLDEAEKVYNELLSLNPSGDDIPAQINHGLGLVKFKSKDFQKAIDYFSMNLKLNPSEEKWLIPEAMFQIGRCYLRLGNRPEAEKWFNKTEDITYDYDFKESMDGKIRNELSR
jgi:tetratricopeptide (TPR) repeat protein